MTREGAWKAVDAKIISGALASNEDVDGGMGGTATVQGTATISITSTEASGTYTAFDDKELVDLAVELKNFK